MTGILLFIGFRIAERIGAYVEGPFDKDGNSFSMPLNTICMNKDLMWRLYGGIARRNLFSGLMQDDLERVGSPRACCFCFCSCWLPALARCSSSFTPGPLTCCCWASLAGRRV